MSVFTMGAAVMHLGARLVPSHVFMWGFQFDAVASPSLPGSATELGDCAENAGFLWGFTVIWEGLLEAGAIFNTDVSY